MEKSRILQRRRNDRPRPLNQWNDFVTPLVAVLLTLVPMTVCAEESADKAVKIVVSLSAKELTEHVPFTVTVLVDYETPSEVVISAPALGSNFKIDSINTGSRFIQEEGDTSKGRRWTYSDFVLSAENSGEVTLPSFMVTINDSEPLYTPPQILEIAAVGVKAPPILYWEKKNPVTQVGKPLTLTLKIRGVSLSSADLPQVRFMLPREAVLETQKLSPKDHGAGVVCRLSLIPLQTPVDGTINIESYTKNIDIENYTIPIPPLIVAIK